MEPPKTEFGSSPTAEQNGGARLDKNHRVVCSVILNQVCMGTVTLQKKGRFSRNCSFGAVHGCAFFFVLEIQDYARKAILPKKITNDDIIFHVLLCTYYND